MRHPESRTAVHHAVLIKAIARTRSTTGRKGQRRAGRSTAGRRREDAWHTPVRVFLLSPSFLRWLCHAPASGPSLGPPAQLMRVRAARGRERVVAECGGRQSGVTRAMRWDACVVGVSERGLHADRHRKGTNCMRASANRCGFREKCWTQFTVGM